MKRIYKLDPAKEADLIKEVEQTLIKNSESKNSHCKNLALHGITVYKGLIYERTIGGEIHRVGLANYNTTTTNQTK